MNKTLTLVANYKDYYYKKTENGQPKPMFRYLLSGSPESIAKYKAVLEAKGIPVYEDEETGKIIYFSALAQGKQMTVLITDNDKIVNKDDEMAGLTALMQNETDPLIKQSFAQEIANVKLGRMRTMLDTKNRVVSNTVGTAQATEEAPAETVEADDADLAG